MFGSCKDCGYEAKNAVDFSDHAHVCLVNPVFWEPTEDYKNDRAEALTTSRKKKK